MSNCQSLKVTVSHYKSLWVVCCRQSCDFLHTVLCPAEYPNTVSSLNRFQAASCLLAVFAQPVHRFFGDANLFPKLNWGSYDLASPSGNCLLHTRLLHTRLLHTRWWLQTSSSSAPELLTNTASLLCTEESDTGGSRDFVLSCFLYYLLWRSACPMYSGHDISVIFNSIKILSLTVKLPIAHTNIPLICNRAYWTRIVMSYLVSASRCTVQLH